MSSIKPSCSSLPPPPSVSSPPPPALTTAKTTAEPPSSSPSSGVSSPPANPLPPASSGASSLHRVSQQASEQFFRQQFLSAPPASRGPSPPPPTPTATPSAPTTTPVTATPPPPPPPPGTTTPLLTTPPPPSFPPTNTDTATPPTLPPAIPTDGPPPLPVAAPAAPGWGRNLSTMEAITRAKDAHSAAKGRVQALESRLASDLAMFGDRLTDTQKQAYAEQFRAEHASAYAQQRQAAQELQATLQAAEAVLRQGSDNVVAMEILNGYNELAKTPGFGEAAIDFVERALGDPQIAYAFSSSKDSLQTILATGISTTANQFLVDSNGDPAQAARRLDALLGELTNNPDLVGLGGSSAPVMDSLFKTQGLLREIAQGPVSAQRMATILDDLGKTPFGRSLGAASLIFGLAGAVQAGQEGDYGSMIANLAGSGAAGAEIVAMAAGNFAQAGRYAAAAGSIQAFSQMAAKILGPLSAGVGFLVSIHDFQSNPNVGAAAELLGNGAAFIGAAMLATGVWAPVGLALVLGGTLASLIGGIFDNQSDQQKAKDDLRREVESILQGYQARLQQIGFSAEDARQIAQESFYASLSDDQRALINDVMR